jgi:hypothetical protein
MEFERNGRMIYFRIALFVIGGILLLLAGAFYWLYRFFENEKKNKDKIKRTGAYLASVKHKTDVPVYGATPGRGLSSIRIEMIIKHRSRGRYEYIVDGKKYRIRHELFVTKRQMPYMVPIVYMIRFPRIAVIRGENFLWVQALLCMGFALIALSNALLRF